MKKPPDHLLFQHLSRINASVVKVFAFPPDFPKPKGATHSLGGYVTLHGALFERTPEEIVRDLGLLSVQARIDLKLSIETCIRVRQPFANPDTGLKGVWICEVTSIPHPIEFKEKLDTRFPDGVPYKPNKSAPAKEWLPGSGLPQFQLSSDVDGVVLGFLPCGTRYQGKAMLLDKPG